ncbi:hypothetical protein VNO77_04975 [Canavalia gladiata]|uniref:Uncharacterized protein n=1 Tax=Canavalia gladiata TaxID=3824 RepID=A0AAN9MY71_CANGL
MRIPSSLTFPQSCNSNSPMGPKKMRLDIFSKLGASIAVSLEQQLLYFVRLAPNTDRMAVITIHKLMALLKTRTEHATIGTATVGVPAVCSIGDTIELRIHFVT